MIDISTPLDHALPSWPGSPGMTLSPLLQIAAGDDANATRIDLDAHTGTHVDAPRHFVADGSTLDELGLGPFTGPCYVAEIDAQRIGRDALAGLDMPPGTRRLLLKTSNSEERLLRRPEFTPNFAALTVEGARWVVENNLCLVGTDYLSIQRYEDGPETHQVLLSSGLAILEGLDLRDVAPGFYDLLCLPLRLIGAEAAPARAVLLPEGTLR